MQSKIRNSKSKIAVVGAGPAGASLAIRLAKENFEVCLIEREKFPRHKLCGEFVSPECFRHFHELGVFKEMLAAGGERIAETIFYAASGESVGVPSAWFNKNEAGALSLSRAAMDWHLLEQARNCGVEILEEHTVVDLFKERETVRGVKVRAGDNQMKEIFADKIIDATGRARVLSKLFARRNDRSPRGKTVNSKSKTRNQLVGFKTHLSNVNLEKGVCEIYFFRGGYGGLSYVENDLANFCFLIDSRLVREFSSEAQQIIEKVVFQNARAAETLKNSAPVHDWLAVAVDGFGRRQLNPGENLFAVGDAGAFIDPFTGSGMLMALESAELLARAIIGNASAETIAAEYRTAHAQKFRKRLFICSLLRRAAFVPTLNKVLISALSRSKFPRKILARATRPTFSTDKNG